jgi:hypothetical protein
MDAPFWRWTWHGVFVFLLKCKINQTKWHFKPMNGVEKAVALGSRSKEMTVVGEGKV